MNAASLEKIGDKKIPQNELLSEVSRLHDAGEPASFWTTIAGDDSYTPAHRAIAICQFFKRHVSTPVSLGKLAYMLQETRWFSNSEIAVVAHLKGEMPVQWVTGETVVTVRAFAGAQDTVPVLYLRLSEPVQVNELIVFFRNPAADNALRHILVQEAGCAF